MIYKQEFKGCQAIKIAMALCFFWILFFNTNAYSIVVGGDLEGLTLIDSPNVTVNLAAGRFNRRTGEITYTATLTNNSNESFPGPIYLAIQNISNASVTVANADAINLMGTPFFFVDTTAFEPGNQLSKAVTFSNSSRVRFTFDSSTFFEPPPVATVLDVGITSPVSGFLTNANEIVITGTFGASVETVDVNGVPAVLQAGSYSATVPLIEGNNTLSAVARNVAGGIGTANVTVVRDSSPPTVAFTTPEPEQIVTTETVQVSGNVNDIVTGTVNEQNCQVIITGRAGSVIASVVNRTFQVTDLTVLPGLNEITVVATDAAGNQSVPAQINVTRQALVGQQLQIVSGNNQTGEINQALNIPVTVRALDVNGSPLPNSLLRFEVTANTGLIKPVNSTEEGQLVQNILTDANGLAAVDWALGNRVGLGNNQIDVSGTGFAAPIQFFASANTGACSQLLALSGENQVGGVGEPLANPLEVVAFDDGGNFCVDQTVTFNVGEGGGNLVGAPSVTVNTNADGRAVAILTLGDAPGINNNSVSATFPGLQTQNVSFIATAVQTGVESETRFIGVVLDNENEPVPNATVQIENTNPLIEGVTNENGQFVLDNVPVGSGLLHIDGTTTTRPGMWPTLEFQFVAVSGIDNSLGRPIFLPELDGDSFQLIGGSEDVVLTMDGVDGFAMRVFANSATFPDGSSTGLMGVTQVSNDQVPMPPSGGAAPPWVGTLQPPGVFFDPPVQLTVPNSFGLPPNQIVNMFSFDHDLQQFVSIGTGTVQTDGATIVSDPGSGIRKSGWFFDCPPPPPPAEVFNSSNPIANQSVRDIFKDALDDSDGGTATEHEEGGWLIRDADGNIRVQRWPTGGEDAITPDNPMLNDGEEVFGSFHTHPENPEFESTPSQADIDSTQTTIDDFGLTDAYTGCFVVNDNQINHVGTDGTVSQVNNTGP